MRFARSLAPRRDEQTLQRALCQHLELRAARGLVWFAVPNGGWRSPVEAAIFKGLGIKAGVADLILHDGKFFALELKSETGRATDAQRNFIEAVIAAGGHAAIGRGVDECLQILEGWRLLSGQAQCALASGFGG